MSVAWSRPGARETLQARARALAAAPASASAAGPVLKVVEFTLAEERYALEMRYVAQVHPLVQLAPLPCTPDFYAGIINVRGRIVAVLDLKRFFELPDTGITDLHRVVVVRNEEIELGILADAVLGTRELAVDALQASLPTLTGVRLEYLRGITADRVVVLDAGRLLGDPKLLVNDASTS